MQVRWNRFETVLNDQSPVARCYLFYGDEACIQMELRDTLIAWLEKKGFEHGTLSTIDQGNASWDPFNEALEGMSLFSQQTQLDIRVSTEKLPLEGSKWLTTLPDRWHEDIVVLLSIPKLDKAALNSKWFQALEQKGAVMIATPTLDRSGFKEWVQWHTKGCNFRFDSEALDYFLQSMEGNLFAARQVFERLKLLGFNGVVNSSYLDQHMDQAARYEVQQLSEAWMQGAIERCLNILSTLRVEPEIMPLVLWQLGEDLHAWWALSQRKTPTMLWGGRKTALERRVQSERINAKQLRRCLSELVELDRSFKGIGTQGIEVWNQLEKLIIRWATLKNRANTPIQS